MCICVCMCVCVCVYVCVCTCVCVCVAEIYAGHVPISMHRYDGNLKTLPSNMKKSHFQAM